MSKKEQREFIERTVMILTSGVEAKSWSQVRLATAALAKEVGVNMPARG